LHEEKMTMERISVKAGKILLNLIME